MGCGRSRASMSAVTRSPLMRAEQMLVCGEGRRCVPPEQRPGRIGTPIWLGGISLRLPNQLWVTVTHVPTWAGMGYVCFITDVDDRGLVAANMRTQPTPSRWPASVAARLTRCHSDAGSQFTSVRYGERLRCLRSY